MNSQKRNFVHELLQVVFASLASSFPSLAHAAYSLLAALAKIEQLSQFIKTFTLEFAATKIQDKGGLHLSAPHLRGLGLILHATRHMRILGDSFPLDLLALLNERLDARRFFFFHRF
jgi:hypothetical protein